MSIANTGIGPSLAEPIAGQPADLPIRAEDSGNPPPRVKVHTELGIPIWFDPASAQFSAQVGEPVQGRGTTMALHSANFATIVERIRQRALVVPVQGFLVDVKYRPDPGEDPVTVRPCTVIEHHPRRQFPFVVRLKELALPSRRNQVGASPQWVTRVRTVHEVLLPQPSHVEAVRVAQQAVLDEEQRHQAAMQHGNAAVRAALEAIPRLTAADLRSVQVTQQQVAWEQEALGVASYTVLDDDDEEEETV